MKIYSKYLNNNENTNLLKRFAYTGDSEFFSKKLDYLRSIAEPENWNQTDNDSGYKNSTLFYYIVHTFDRCYRQTKIVIDENEENAVFNTGLMTPQGDEIYGVFVKSLNYSEEKTNFNYWHFQAFVEEGSRRFMQLNLQKPELATYFNNFNELYFNPDYEIELNFDHIYDDNFHRLPKELTTLDKTTARHVFEGFLNFTRKKIKRNNRIPVPQFYNNKISFLIPVKVFGTKTVVIAVEKINGVYSGNTVLTMGMAYNCARLINKPESEWLLNEENYF